MLPTILLNSELASLQLLEQHIHQYCPQLKICGKTTSIQEARDMIAEQLPSLAFVEVELPKGNGFKFVGELAELNFETIFLSENEEDAIKAANSQACGFLLKPYQPREIITVVNKAEECIRRKRKNIDHQDLLRHLSQQFPPYDRIGIPTIEGFEVFQVSEIIRCEGLQNCTRIITKRKTDIISSYTIGKFVKMLEAHHFFAPHKSHLINLAHIKKYYNEGTIQMSDHSHVPVAKRRKSQFLKLMLHSR